VIFVLGLFMNSIYEPVLEEQLIDSLGPSESREIEFVLNTRHAESIHPSSLYFVEFPNTFVKSMHPTNPIFLD